MWGLLAQGREEPHPGNGGSYRASATSPLCGSSQQFRRPSGFVVLMWLCVCSYILDTTPWGIPAVPCSRYICACIRFSRRIYPIAAVVRPDAYCCSSKYIMTPPPERSESQHPRDKSLHTPSRLYNRLVLLPGTESTRKSVKADIDVKDLPGISPNTY